MTMNGKQPLNEVRPILKVPLPENTTPDMIMREILKVGVDIQGIKNILESAQEEAIEVPLTIEKVLEFASGLEKEEFIELVKGINGLIVERKKS